MSSMFRRDLYGFMQDSDIGRNLSSIGFALNELLIIEKYKTLKEKRAELIEAVKSNTEDLESAKSHRMIFVDMDLRTKFMTETAEAIKKDREELVFIGDQIDILEQYLFHGEVKAENHEDEDSQSEQLS